MLEIHKIRMRPKFLSVLRPRPPCCKALKLSGFRLLSPKPHPAHSLPRYPSRPTLIPLLRAPSHSIPAVPLPYYSPH